MKGTSQELLHLLKAPPQFDTAKKLLHWDPSGAQAPLRELYTTALFRQVLGVCDRGQSEIPPLFLQRMAQALRDPHRYNQFWALSLLSERPALVQKLQAPLRELRRPRWWELCCSWRERQIARLLRRLVRSP